MNILSKFQNDQITGGGDIHILIIATYALEIMRIFAFLILNILSIMERSILLKMYYKTKRTRYKYNKRNSKSQNSNVDSTENQFRVFMGFKMIVTIRKKNTLLEKIWLKIILIRPTLQHLIIFKFSILVDNPTKLN